MLTLTGWPAGMRVIARKERPHPGAQLPITDPGVRNLPLHALDSNRIWCAIVTLAAEITAWMQLIARTSTDARRWEPKRLRLRLFTLAATLTRHSQKVVLTLNQKQPWATVTHQAVTALRALPTPG